MRQYTVVIPYYAAGAQGRELEYAVAGWRNHFQEQYHIVVIGDYHPVSDSGSDISYYPCERIAAIPGQYLPHLDMAHKMLTFMDAYPGEKGFIWVADDCYAVNPFDIHDVRMLKCKDYSMEQYEKSTGICGEDFRKDKLKTRDILLQNQRPARNFTTHLPRWYDAERLRSVLNGFNATRESYVIEDLYYNIFYPDRVPLRLSKEKDNLKYGVFNQGVTPAELDAAAKRKIWINNSTTGWGPELETWLQFRLMFQ